MNVIYSVYHFFVYRFLINAGNCYMRVKVVNISYYDSLIMNSMITEVSVSNLCNRLPRIIPVDATIFDK